MQHTHDAGQMRHVGEIGAAVVARLMRVDEQAEADSLTGPIAEHFERLGYETEITRDLDHPWRPEQDVTVRHDGRWATYWDCAPTAAGVAWGREGAEEDGCIQFVDEGLDLTVENVVGFIADRVSGRPYPDGGEAGGREGARAGDVA